MTYIYPPHLPACLTIADHDALFAVRRVYCVGRNYAEHAREMGSNPEREPPFFFAKPNDSDCILPVLPNQTAQLPYPPQTQNLHYEVELVVAIGKDGKNISVDNAVEHIFGYAVGIDMTRRDIQAMLKNQSRPWELAKGFDFSAPIGRLHPISQVGELTTGKICLSVNDDTKQQGDISEMIWSINETIANLSTFVTLKAGDLIFTGTPAGVGAVVKGDVIVAKIDNLSDVHLIVS